MKPRAVATCRQTVEAFLAPLSTAWQRMVAKLGQQVPGTGQTGRSMLANQAETPRANRCQAPGRPSSNASKPGWTPPPGNRCQAPGRPADQCWQNRLKPPGNRCQAPGRPADQCWQNCWTARPTGARHRAEPPPPINAGKPGRNRPATGARHRTDPRQCCQNCWTAPPQQVPGTNGTVRLGSARKFSSGTWKIFVILPRALAIDDDFKNLPWLKSRTFLASAN